MMLLRVQIHVGIPLSWRDLDRLDSKISRILLLLLIIIIIVIKLLGQMRVLERINFL